MRNLFKWFILAISVYFYTAGIALCVEPPTGINLGHDFTVQLTTGDLTSTVQYSTIDSTTTKDIAITMFSKDIDFSFGTGAHKYIIDCYFYIVCEFSSATTNTADVEWKPQARNDDGTWTDLASYVDMPDVDTTFTESVLKGYATTSATFDEVPFNFRILMKCDEADEGIGKVKSGSYIRVTFEDITWGE